MSSAAQVVAQQRTTNYDWVGKNDFGGAGLIQGRSARMPPDGTLEVGFSSATPYKRYFITLQATPWLEGTFRYTEITNRLFSQFSFFSGRQTFKDRGADLSFRLLEEQKFLPAVALTLQDGLGTGQFSGEYLTANKRFYDLDLSVGLAWGYAASGSLFKNPLAELSPAFARRVGGGRTGGQLSINSFFSGPNIAPYGGIAYRTPIDGLTLKWEYEPNDYQKEPQSNRFKKHSPYNFGLSYRPFPWIEASLNRERGNLTTFRVSMRSNFNDPGMPKFDPPPPNLKPRAVIAKELELVKSSGSSAINEPVGANKNAAEPKVPTIENSESRWEVTHISGDVLRDNIRVGMAPLRRNDGIRSASIGDAEFHSSDEGHSEKNYNGLIVDYLFDELEAEGLRLENINFSHGTVEAAVSRMYPEATPSAKAARLVLRAMPTPVSSVTMVLCVSCENAERITYDRDEVERMAAVDDLFDAMEGMNFKVEGFELSHRVATLRILANKALLVEDYAETAQFVADAVQTSVDQVTVITLRAGIEKARVTVRRGALVERNKKLVASGAGEALTPAAFELNDVQKRHITDRLVDKLSEEFFFTEGVLLDGHAVTVYGTATRFRQFARGIGRAMRVISNNVPPHIEEMTVVSLSGGMEVNRITVRRKDLENAVGFHGSVEEIWANSKIEEGQPGILLPETANRNWLRYPRLRWSLSPQIRSHIGGPDQFVLYQFWASIGGSVELWRGLGIAGRIGRDIYNNFHKITLESDSSLPHVRSDIGTYLKEGQNNIVNFYANYMFSPMPEWYARLSWGLFEEMYGGVGGEVLYRPFNSRFAFGMDLNKVRQRDFDQRFTYRDYKVTTGHLNFYYQLPVYDLLSVVNVGQYLAGDKGVTYSISRRFNSGITMGAWATLTDVSAEQFGEGSFDKGIFVTVPFELFFTKSSTRTGAFAFRPLFRDGGQALASKSRLYDVTNAANLKEVIHDWNRFLD